MEKAYPYSSFESISAVDEDLEAGSAAHSPIPRPRLRRARAGPTRFTDDLKFFSDGEDDCGPRRHFLDSCFLCKKPLGVGYGQDIFMYRGDTPFCSEDCRQEQIEIDEAMEKRKLKMSTKDKNNPQKIHVRASAGTVVAL